MVCEFWNDSLMSDIKGNKMDVDLTKPGVLGFGTVAKDAKICFSIPFNSDPEHNEFEVKHCLMGADQS